MNDTVIRALRKYIDDDSSVYSFNGLVVKAAQQYLNETGLTSFNDLVRRAANAYTGTQRISTNDAVRDALIAYTGSTSLAVPDLVNQAAVKYIETPDLNPPVNTTAPVVTGTTQQGSVLSTTNGVWTNSPTGYTYQWQRAGSNISGATSSTYTLVSGDVGALISVVVTAANADGSTAATSNSVGPVTAPTVTYDDFVTHIATLGATARVWAANANATGIYTTNAATPVGGLSGSSWGPSSAAGFPSSTGSALDRVVQHGMASQAAFDEQVANSGLIYLEISAVLSATVSFPAVTRNGFTSSSAAATLRRELLEMRYWNFTLGRAERIQPSLGLGPTPYTW